SASSRPRHRPRNCRPICPWRRRRRPRPRKCPASRCREPSGTASVAQASRLWRITGETPVLRVRLGSPDLPGGPSMTPLRLGTRKSPLALWQAHHVAGLLGPLAAPRPVELVLIETEGDRVRDRPLSQIGGDGLFTKEIQNAVLDGRADIAVHSLKD